MCADRISEVAPGIFRIVVPLPFTEVQSMNSYVIVDGSRSLIVDPGMAHPACYEVMERAIGDLCLDLGRTDFFITHHHLDHFSAVSKFLSATSCIYISKPEAEFIEQIASGAATVEIAVVLEMLGFPDQDPMFVVSQFFSDGYGQRSWPFHCIANGDAIARGDHSFTCLVAAGHSAAHSSLYEANRGILIAGDQITAGVQFLLDRANPLEDHLQSLARIREMDIQLVLPGHGSPFKDHERKIADVCAHYQGRLDAACAVLGKAGKDAYEVAVALDGLLPDRERLDTLPPVRKFIHTRHTFACLRHLANRGQAIEEHYHGRVLFFQTSRN
jgi:glyoxylase-like metal-dependent hydrolase (beta-lactamase superfamily II)